MKHARLTRYLVPATVVYLAVPLGIFFGGWVRWPLAVGSISLLGAAVWKYEGISLEEIAGQNRRVAVGKLLLGLLPVVLLISISGSGGWGFQDPIDWQKHNAILHDLIYNPWPVAYDTPEGPLAMVYYIAYYLPAAVVGKVLGWQAANLALFLTTLGGATLTYLWVVVLTRIHPVLCGVLFLSFSGMDILGNLLYNAPRWDHLEWYSMDYLGQYSSNTTLLFWIPHQAFAGWLITALTVSAVRTNRLHRVCLFLIALSGLWSPFVGVGVAFLVIPLLAVGYRKGQFTLPDATSLCNAAGCVIGGVLLLYFLSRYMLYPLPARIAELPTGGFSLNALRDGFAVLYVLFVLLEFLVLYSLILAYRERLERDFRRLFWIVLPFLLVLPFFRYGAANDLVMRASIPALFVTLLLTGRVMRQMRPGLFNRTVPTLLIAVILIGSVTPTVEVIRHGYHTYRRGKLVVVPKRNSVKSIWELQRQGAYGRDEFNFVGQYVGATNSLFFRYGARQLDGERQDLSATSEQKK